MASLVGGAALEAPFSEIFNLVIAEAKKVKHFKHLSEDLTSTMERIVPILQEIGSLLQERSDRGNDELNLLFETTTRAKELVRKCSCVHWYSIAKKISYTKEINEINQVFLKFCQLDVQCILLRNQLRFEQVKEDEQLAAVVQDILNKEESHNIHTRASLDEDEIVKAISLCEAEARDDEQLAFAIQQSYYV